MVLRQQGGPRPGGGSASNPCLSANHSLCVGVKKFLHVSLPGRVWGSWTLAGVPGSPHLCSSLLSLCPNSCHSPTFFLQTTSVGFLSARKASLVSFSSAGAAPDDSIPLQRHELSPPNGRLFFTHLKGPFMRECKSKAGTRDGPRRLQWQRGGTVPGAAFPHKLEGADTIFHP